MEADSHQDQRLKAWLHIVWLISSQVLELRLEKLNVKGFSTENLYYHSCGWLSTDDFGAGRLVREVTNSYLAGKFAHCGSKFSSEAPELSQAEIESVPGAAASLGSWDGLKFEVLERAGESMQIKQDEHRYWVCQTGAIAEQYTTLRNAHVKLVERVGTRSSSSTRDAAEAGQETSTQDASF